MMLLITSDFTNISNHTWQNIISVNDLVILLISKLYILTHNSSAKHICPPKKKMLPANKWEKKVDNFQNNYLIVGTLEIYWLSIYIKLF